jgi:hypothetical protein
MTCEKSVEITAYLQGEGSDEERAMLRRHFDGCESCTRDLGQFERALGALGKIETLEPSPGFKDRVQEAFLRDHPQFAPKPRLKLVYASSIAAGLLIAVLGTVVVLRSGVDTEDHGKMGNIAPELIADEDLQNSHVQRPKVHYIGNDWSLAGAYDARIQSLLGSPGVDARVARAARWLLSKQEKDGSWKGADEGDAVELTGLALLVCRHGNADVESLQRGLNFLKSRQRDSGAIGGGSAVSHAIATLALLQGGEAASAAKAVELIVTQNQGKPWGEGEVAGWQFQALRVAAAGGNKSVIGALSNGRMTRAKPGVTSHAAALRARLWADPSPDQKRWREDASWLLETSPILGTDPANYSRNDLAFAYFGTQLLRPLGGDAWKKWWSPLQAKLEKTQGADGSWPAGFEPGRSQEYATALAALVLDTELRVPPLEE